MPTGKNTQDKELFVVTCQLGLENVLAEELQSLGIKPHETIPSTVSFYGHLRELYLVNMNLRTALHILKPLKSFKAANYDMVYNQAKKIQWHQFFTSDKSMRIDIKGKSTILSHSQYLTHRLKDAILDSFRKLDPDQRPEIDKRTPDIEIIAYVSGSQVTLYLDSSGVPLFKRGYRIHHGQAPIKEDLAAGIILLSDWDKKSFVLDPMCGTSTFLIEAYMIANRIPPNLERNFSFMHWENFDSPLYQLVKKESESHIIKSDTEFLGYEIDRRTIDIARTIIRKLKFTTIKVERMDFKKSNTIFDKIFVVSNPPYGERLQAGKDLKPFYQAIGDFLKQKCKNSQASIFTANLKDAKFIGLKTKAKIKLYNGPLEGRLLKWDIY